MKTLKFKSQKAQNYINAYWNSDKTSLSECYKTYSHDKAQAEKWCREQMINENGSRFRIISHSHFYFTCGWICGNDYRIETPQNSYRIHTQ